MRGCHTSTPDGAFVGLTASPDATTGDRPAYVDIRSVDGGLTQPAFATPSAASLRAAGAARADVQPGPLDAG